jgi:hypothetical protein
MKCEWTGEETWKAGGWGRPEAEKESQKSPRAVAGARVKRRQAAQSCGLQMSA